MSREKQIQQLLAVCLFAYLPSIIYAVYLLISETNTSDDSNSGADYTFTIIHMVLSLSLLAKVLSVRGISFHDLGITITWKYVLGGVALAFSGWILFGATHVLLRSILPVSYQHLLQPKNVCAVTNGFTMLLLLFLVLNPFCEELIVRGFLMREMFSLTGSKTVAVVVSVLFQTSYHLYQGVVPALLTALIFLLFSMFYIKTGNLTSVIVAHLVMDLAILVRSGIG